VNRPINRTVVSLDVGSSGVRAAQFSLRGKGCRLDRYAAAPLDPGVVAAGVVIDPAALAKVLKELWSVGRFTSKEVVFGLANDRILVRQLDLDWMEPGDFRKALAYSVADQIPMSVDEANLDFHVLEEIPASAELGLERALRVLLVAAGRDMVEGFTTALTEAGLRPIKAELAPFALIRVACPDGPVPVLDANTAEAIVDIGADTLTVVVHAGGQPRFVRTVGKLGGRFITGELQQKFGWTYDEAEAAKARYGLPRQRPAGDDLVALEHPAQQAIAERVNAVVAEIRTTLNFFLSASTGITRLSRVVLTGGGARLVGLADRVAEGLRVEVAELLPPVGVRVRAPGSEPPAPPKAKPPTPPKSSPKASAHGGRAGKAGTAVAEADADTVTLHDLLNSPDVTRSGGRPEAASAVELAKSSDLTSSEGARTDAGRVAGSPETVGLALLAGLALGVV
jgi:type IV pilus assembly protein PilM